MKKIVLTLMVVCIISLASLLSAAEIYPSNPSCTITLKDGIKYSAVHTGDVNNDGAQDIVVSIYGNDGIDSSVDVFYQKDGGFTSKAALHLSIKSPRGAVVKDIDGDGKNDIAINESRRYINLCYAKNNFKPQRNFDVNMTSDDLLDVDLNKSDKDITSLLALSVWWRVAKDGTVKQTYIARPPSNLSGFPAAGDLNDDGDIDLVYSQDYRLLLYYGPFTPVGILKPDMLSEHKILDTGKKIASVYVGDYNGDGKQDIAAYQAGTGISFYYQGSPMGFSDKASSHIKGSFQDIKSADVNNDKLDDIIAIDSNLKAIRIFLQKADGGFAESIADADQIITGNRYYKLDISDINNDGKNDLIISGYGNFVAVYYGK